MKKVIAIDGPSGAGKSTIARLLAKELGYDYLDTGALYRATALGLRRLGLDENSSDRKISMALKKISVRFRKGKALLNRKDVSEAIRSPEASHFASVFSARRPVRGRLLEAQREAAQRANLVAEGRDMTTVVFPAADWKFYLDASAQERARRRGLELAAKGYGVNAEKILLDIMERDARDSGRDIAPLTKAPDAHCIDSTGLSVEEVYREILAIIGREDRTAGRPKFEVVVAKRAGFCFGVKRAMDITVSVAEEHSRGVYTLGPLIHNPQVISQLEARGIGHLEPSGLSRKKVDALIIRTHGIPRDLYAKITARGLKIIDATCPFVTKAQEYARSLKEKGYQVLILGDRRHPEVMGILSYAGSDAVVVENGDPLPKLKTKVGIVVQTTQSVEALKRLLPEVIAQTRELKVYNTICSSTALRLKETGSMAKCVDAMVVVGGKNSANTSQLTNLCSALGVTTYHIETADELDARWFSNARRVGVTAGASTPDWIIDEVARKLRILGGDTLHGE